MTAGAGTAEAHAGRAGSGAANRRLTIVTSVWIAAQLGMLAWLVWRIPALTIGQGPDVIPRSEFWTQVATFAAVAKVFAALLTVGPAGLAWAAARAGLRSRAISYGLVMVGLIPIAAVAWWFGSAS